LNWIQNFLTRRTHQTRVGSSVSEIADLLSGVVQGNGLGPLLFLVFVDGLAKALESVGVVTKFFADDVKVYLQIVKYNDCIILQKALDLISHSGQVIGSCKYRSKSVYNVLHVGPRHVSFRYSIGNDM